MDSYPVGALYEFSPKVESATSAPPNPLSSVGALNESELIDVRLSPQRSRVGILIDTRMCEDFDGSNTALVVLTGVAEIRWSNDDWSRRRPWIAQYASLDARLSGEAEIPFPPWNPGGGNSFWAEYASEPTPSLTQSPEAENNRSPDYVLKFGALSVSASSAQIYIGHVMGLDGAIPDMTELSDPELVAGFPQWSSVMKVHEYHVYPEPESGDARR